MTGKANKKILLAILVFACILRLSMLYINMHRHPSFFNTNTFSIHQQISSNTTPYLNPFGYEIANIAYSLVCKKEGFSNPFGGATGPTGWVAPGIVILYAAAFYLFGCFSKASILFMFSLSFCLSLIMIMLIYVTTVMLFHNRFIGYISAFLFAICPQDTWFVLYASQTDCNIYAFLFLLNFLLFLRFISTLSRLRLILFSGTAGISLLFNPILVLPLCTCYIFFLVRSVKTKEPFLQHVVISIIIIASIITPYILYQKSRLGIWTFIKSNGPYEIYLGNTIGYSGVLEYDLFLNKHPGSNAEEFQEYCKKGEADYIRAHFQQFIQTFHTSSFIYLTIKRFFYFFFILKPYIMPERFDSLRLLAEYMGYALPGLAFLLYLLTCYKKMQWNDYLIYCYILAYSLPYLIAGVMYRYSFPICTLATILLAHSLGNAILLKRKVFTSKHMAVPNKKQL